MARGEERRTGLRTGIDFPAKDHADTSHSGLDDGAVLGAIVDDLVFAAFDFFARARVPWFSEDG